MQENLSRIVHLIEMVVIALPASAVFLVVSPLLLPNLTSGADAYSGFRLAFLAILFLALLFLVVAWRVSFAFLRNGRSGLRALHPFWVRLMYVAGVTVFVALGVTMLTMQLDIEGLEVSTVLALGSPMLIPFAHLALEQHFGSR